MLNVRTELFSALQNLDYNLVECQALVLAPTRELAQQIEKVWLQSGLLLGATAAAAARSRPVLAVWLLALCAAWHPLDGSTAPGQLQHEQNIVLEHQRHAALTP